MAKAKAVNPKKAPKAATGFRNRIIAHKTVNAADLIANPKNWRCHPDQQRSAMVGVLDELGWVSDVIVNKTTNYVLDGHLRVAIAAERGYSVPVKFVDLTEEEERKFIAVFDAIGDKATADADKLEELLRSFTAKDQSLQNLIDELAVEHSIDLAAPVMPDMPGTSVQSPGADVAQDFPGGDLPAGPATPPGVGGLSIIGSGGLGGNYQFLRFGKIETPMTDEEVVLLGKAYRLYCEEQGTNYGFTHWLLEHVRSKLPD